jgi:transposase-like protein
MDATVRNASLSNFIGPDMYNFESKNSESSSTAFATEKVFCPNCGIIDKVIKRGNRNTKYRGQVQRYECKICRKRFVHTPYARMRWPDWVVDAVLDLKVNGLRDSQIAKAVSQEAKRRNEHVQLSPKSIINIVRRVVKITLEFERYAPRKEKASTWLIDDTPQPWSKNRTPSQSIANSDTDSETEYFFFWITNVLEDETRYWLSGISSDNRCYSNSELAMKNALLRAKYGPQLIKCDGYKGHVKGTRQVLKHVEIIAKTKKEDYGWINHIERLHQTIRSLAIKKRKHFRSLENLALSVELVRIYYNFMRSHESLSGMPPAKRAGIEYPYHACLTWTELIHFAFTCNKRRRRFL